MRMPNEDEDLIGKVCVCSIGRIGLVTGKGNPVWADEKDMWIGLGFDGKGTWASSNPCIAYENPEEYRQLLSKRFGGKMSFNS